MAGRKQRTQQSGAAAGVPAYEDRVGPLAYADRANGPALAAVVAAGTGAFVLGLVTTLAEASAWVKNALQWSASVGPLSGKTATAVFLWALTWAVLGSAWRTRDVDFNKAVVVSAVLAGLGFLGTFPTFFERFAAK